MRPDGSVAAFGLFALAIPAARAAPATPMVPIYIGTYTDGASRGIYRLELDRANARLSEPVLVAEAVNPSFLAWHPTRSVLYAVSETDTVGAAKSGALMAFESTDGRTDGDQPGAQRRRRRLLRVSERGGTYAFVANYGAGQRRGLSAPRGWRGDARLGARAAHGIGSAPDAADPCARTLDSPDPGQPRSSRRRSRGRPALRLSLRRIHGHLAAAPAVRPWHSARRRAAPLCAAPIRRCRVRDERAELDDRDVRVGRSARHTRQRGEVSTLPDGFTGENTTAEVAVHPNGRFVYGSNRGNDSIAAFRVSADRTLTRVGVYPTGGRTPRHFAIDPPGDLLIAANQESDTLVLFRIDESTGALAETAARARVPSPVFVGIRPER